MSPTTRRRGSFANVGCPALSSHATRARIQPGGAGRTARPVAAGGVREWGAPVVVRPRKPHRAREAVQRVSIDDAAHRRRCGGRLMAFGRRNKDATAEAQAQNRRARLCQTAVRARRRRRMACGTGRRQPEQARLGPSAQPNPQPSLGPCSNPATARPHAQQPAPAQPQTPPPEAPVESYDMIAPPARPGRRSNVSVLCVLRRVPGAFLFDWWHPAGSSSSPSRCTTGSPTSSKTTNPN